ncbi:MAG: glycosyltransferase family 2 protein [Candidatus Dadabacteria bacterium]|nr:MAG: glycosyltransferase family 2 protein [Candidatus Dadabacteria bacterium]
MLLALSVPEILKHWELFKDEELSGYLRAERLPPISVLVPAYNMAPTILDTVACLLDLDYPRHEVVVVDDGSTDDTMAKLHSVYDLYEDAPSFEGPIPTKPVHGQYRSRTHPNLRVIQKANGGKADALNAALCSARYELVLCVDADTLVERDALLRLARTFLVDSTVAAAGATIRVANGCRLEGQRVVEARVPRTFLAGMQVPEYLRAFLFGRLGWNALGGNLIVSGAFGLFRKAHLLAIGGYTVGSVGEDLDLVVRLHRYLREKGVEYSIPFIPDPIAWTIVPEDLATLGRQRERWHRGLIVTMLKNLKLLGNPAYGKVGLIIAPFFVLGEMLAPLVEFFGVVLTVGGLYFGVVDLEFALLFFAACWGYGTLLTLAAVVMEEVTFQYYPRFVDFLWLVGFALLEPFGYRQATVLWRARAFLKALVGSTSWGAMRRRAFAPATGVVG